MYKPGGTIADVLDRIQKTIYVFPAIQREFVWKPEQIEKLFDSLMQGYPCEFACNSDPRLECAPEGGQVGRWDLTPLLGFRRMEAMTKHRSHSAAFERQVAESLSGIIPRFFLASAP